MPRTGHGQDAPPLTGHGAARPAQPTSGGVFWGAPPVLGLDPINDLVHYLDRPLLSTEGWAFSALDALKIVAYLAVLTVMARWTRSRLVRWLLARTGAAEGVRFAVARVTGYLIWAIGVLIGLSLLRVDLSHVFVALGALGVGVGLGLQNVTENLVGGLILLVARPINVGDRIRLGDLEGTVTDIGPRVTQIRTNDNILILVPNAHLASQQIVNLTLNDRIVRFSFPVGVAYGSDADQVRELLLQVASAHPDILDDPAPAVLFRRFGESALEFELRAFSRTRVSVPEVLRSEVNFAIWRALRDAGIQIPFPQRDLHLRTLPPELAGRLGPDAGARATDAAP